MIASPSILLLLLVSFASYTLTNGQWNLVLPPDFQRTAFLGMIPYTMQEGGDTSVVVSFASGEIYEIDLETDTVTVLHVSNDLQASLLNAPSTYSTTLNSFTIAGPQQTLYAHAQDGSIYFVSLSDQPTVRVWAKRAVSPATVQARFMIPLSNEHSTDLLVIYDNTFVTLHNLFYNSSIVLGNFVGKPTTALYTDLASKDSNGNTYIQDLLLVGGDTGLVTLFVELAGVSSTYSLGSVGGKVGQILHYRSGQKNSYIIYNTIDSPTATANNRIVIVDLANNRALRQFTTGANNITIFSDYLLHDWLIFSNSSGIYKQDLTNYNSSSPFIPIQISAGFNAYSSASSTNPILSLQSNYIQVTDSHTGKTIRVPCLMVVSQQGILSIMRGDNFNWQEIGNPLELASVGNTLVAASVIQASTTDLAVNAFSIVAVLDDGAIVSRTLPDVQFLAGIYDNSEERISVQPLSSKPINTTQGGVTTKPLSYSDLKAVVQEGRPVILTFQDSNRNPVQYQLLGFDEETNTRRQDSPKLILQMAQTVTNAETLQKYNLGFFPALLGAIEVAYDVCLIGADLWDIGTQLYYTGTTIYNTLFNTDNM